MMWDISSLAPTVRVVRLSGGAVDIDIPARDAKTLIM
jgi:hypothetical protein